MLGARVEQLRVGAGHPGRGIPQVLGVDRDTQRRQEIGRGAPRRLQVDARAVVRDVQCPRHG